MKNQYKFVIKIVILIFLFKVLLAPFLSGSIAMKFVPELLAFVVFLISLKFNLPIDFRKREVPDERLTKVVDKSSKITLMIMFVVGSIFSFVLRINNMVEANGILSIFALICLVVFIVTTIVVDGHN